MFQARRICRSMLWKTRILDPNISSCVVYVNKQGLTEEMFGIMLNLVISRMRLPTPVNCAVGL